MVVALTMVIVYSHKPSFSLLGRMFKWLRKYFYEENFDLVSYFFSITSV